MFVLLTIILVGSYYRSKKYLGHAEDLVDKRIRRVIRFIIVYAISTLWIVEFIFLLSQVVVLWIVSPDYKPPQDFKIGIGSIIAVVWYFKIRGYVRQKLYNQCPKCGISLSGESGDRCELCKGAQDSTFGGINKAQLWAKYTMWIDNKYDLLESIRMLTLQFEAVQQEKLKNIN